MERHTTTTKLETGCHQVVVNLSSQDTVYSSQSWNQRWTKGAWCKAPKASVYTLVFDYYEFYVYSKDYMPFLLTIYTAFIGIREVPLREILAFLGSIPKKRITVLLARKVAWCLCWVSNSEYFPYPLWNICNNENLMVSGETGDLFFCFLYLQINLEWDLRNEYKKSILRTWECCPDFW